MIISKKCAMELVTIGISRPTDTQPHILYYYDDYLSIVQYLSAWLSRRSLHRRRRRRIVAGRSVAMPVDQLSPLT